MSPSTSSACRGATERAYVRRPSNAARKPPDGPRSNRSRSPVRSADRRSPVATPRHRRTTDHRANARLRSRNTAPSATIWSWWKDSLTSIRPVIGGGVQALRRPIRDSCCRQQPAAPRDLQEVEQTPQHRFGVGHQILVLRVRNTPCRAGAPSRPAPTLPKGHRSAAPPPATRGGRPWESSPRACLGASRRRLARRG